jgi:hypothetical protein
MGMCATDTESLKQILRRCGFSSDLAAMVALSAVVVVVDLVAAATVVDAVDSLNVPSSLYFKGSCVIWEKLILGRMFSLSMFWDDEVWDAGFGGMTPPNPIARIILIFRAMAGLGALSTAPLKMPRLFSSLDRTWSFDLLFDIFRLESRELDRTEHVLFVVDAAADVEVDTSIIIFLTVETIEFFIRFTRQCMFE